MAAPKGKERREPVFDVAPAAEPDDYEPTLRRSKTAAGGDKPAARPKAKSKRKRRSTGGGGRSWSALAGPAFFWGAGGSLRLGVAAIGGTIRIASHPPPIPCVDIPKRP